jgi:hypothetical protein
MVPSKEGRIFVPSKEGRIYTLFQYLQTMVFGVPRTKKAAAVIWCRTIRAVLRYICRLLAVCPRQKSN